MMVLLFFAFLALASAKPHLLSDEFLELLQSTETTWTAGRNFHNETSEEFLKGIDCVLPELDDQEAPRTLTIPRGFVIPESFDSREAWPNCRTTINEIQDQGSCGSCWAVATTSVMSDRTCILTGGETKFRYSVENLLSCCTDCGNGCGGGSPGRALEYWVNTGIVSGGPYNSKAGCQPYSIPECQHYNSGGDLPHCGDLRPTPYCRNICQPQYDSRYSSDLRYGSDSYLVHRDNIQYEIMNHGPVAASFDVYDDFLSYKSGVYRNIAGDSRGRHIVRCIGWGVEDGTPYWLMANSWNTDWGNKGYFKILRGSDLCGVESRVRAGKPRVESRVRPDNRRWG